VHPAGHDAAHRCAQALGAGDELVGAEPADQLLVAGSGHRHGAEPAQRGELQREPAQRAGRARDQQPLAGLQRELARTIAGVSQKMLTQTLRLLERDGLVTRTITASVPVRVDYQLTPLGRTLLPVVRAIKDWSETHISEVHAARAAYDHA
jgi:DNA-binding MarR family transcriptional regulator